MAKLLEFSIFNIIRDALAFVGKYLSMDLVFYCFVGLEVFVILYFIIKTRYSYELRMLRTLDRLNLYLLSNPYVKEENLIEFNKIMKRVPHALRYHWQQYMLGRDKAPSEYMSSLNIIEKPLKSSALVTNIKTTWFLTGLFALLSTLCSICNLFVVGENYKLSVTLLTLAIIPTIILTIGSITCALQRIRKDVGIKELYNVFHIFQNLMDKACTTIPAYVDFEVLFTQKEISKGIPALNDYLEKRDRQIQEEMEKARLNAVEHEVYDFEDVDINGTLVLERALKETEVYINLRARITGEIQQIEGEIESLQKAYDNQQREFQRKLQASKENVTRLRQQQESTTNRIDSNYIRKQQADEVNKQQQLEKDNDDTTMKFKRELATLKNEISKRNTELLSQKNYLEKAMVSEYDSYSGKVYKGLKQLVEKRDAEVRKAMISRQELLTKQITSQNERLENLKAENESLRSKIDKIGKELTEKDLYYTEALLKAAKNKNVDIDLTDKPISEFQLEEKQKEMSTAETQYDEFGGYYDEEGYYRYKNGTYYDPQGNFYDEFGGYYDTDGNYHPPVEEGKENPYQPKEVEITEPENTEIQPLQQDEETDAEKEEEQAEEKSKKPMHVLETDEVISAEEIAVRELEARQDSIDKIQEELGQEDEQPAPVEEQPAEISTENEVDGTATETDQPEEIQKEKAAEIAEPEKQPETEEKPVEEKPAPATKKPGRPRKTPVDEAPKPKGKPGRPRKTPVDETPKPKGKPGRPRKKEPELEALDAKIKEETEKLNQKNDELLDDLKNALKDDE